uniref:Uncharacterized protein n=1 Tax=Amphimedon queenslandica TaxID=400682 RepID=A0A1X7UBD7_AMPQE
MAGKETCCLCSSAVSQGTWKTKRRKVTGESSKLTMKVLDTLSKRLYCRKFSCCIKDITNAYFCHKCRSLAQGLANLMTKMKSTENLLIPMIVKLFESIDSVSAMERKRKNYDNVLATKSRRISGEVIDEIQRENILLQKEGDKEVMQLMEEEGELFHREETQLLEEEGESEVILVVEGEGELLHREESQLEEEEGEREAMLLVEGEGELFHREEIQSLEEEGKSEVILVVEGEGELLHREESQLEEEEGEREVMLLVEGEGELLNREESQLEEEEEREVMQLVEGEGEVLHIEESELEEEESEVMQFVEREEEILQREEVPLMEDREVLSDKDDSEPSISVSKC